MASIRQHGDDVWRVQVYVSGERASASFRTRREAAAWGERTERRIRDSVTHRRDLEEKTGLKASPVSASHILGNRVPAMNIAGIYILFDGDRVVYVGQSRNVLSRVASHAEKGRAFTSYFAVPCPECDLDKTERFYIEMLSPPQNRM